MAARLPPHSHLSYPRHLDALAPLLAPDLTPSTQPTTSLSTVAAVPPSPSPLPPPPPPDSRALAFALLGWQARPADDMAFCGACFRRLGLWLYTAAPESTFDVSAPPLRLDLVANHRTYCPWISGAAQQALGAAAGLTGWQVQERVVRNHAPVAADASATVVVTAGSVTDPPSQTKATVVPFPMVEITGDEAAPIVGAHDDETDVGTTRTASERASGSVSKEKTAVEVEREDKVRFARLRELTRSVSTKVKGRLVGRQKQRAGDGEAGR